MLYNIFRRTPVVYERLLAVLFFAFLTGVMAQIKVYLPGNPVPITMQVLAVILTGLMLRPSDAFASMLAYLSLIAAGLPVGAGATAGLSVLTGATAGYLIAFPLAAWLVARLAGSSGSKDSRLYSMIGALAGIAVIYLLGASWLAYVLGSVQKAWLLGVAPFIIVDLAKAVLAVFAGEGIIRTLLHWR